jgi:hypothetical protein
MNSIRGTLKREQKSDEKSDSIQLVKPRFKSGGKGASEKDYTHLYQIDGFFQSKFRILELMIY